METIVLHLKELKEIGNIQQLIIDKLFPSNPFFNTDDSVLPKIQVLIEALCENLCVVVETEYVDKDYRDAYYRLYSTKLRDYERNCITSTGIPRRGQKEIYHTSISEELRLETGEL